MHIDNVHRTNRVTAARLVNEAASWGIPRNRAREVIDELLANAPNAIERAADATEDLPAALIDTVHGQLKQLLSAS